MMEHPRSIMRKALGAVLVALLLGTASTAEAQVIVKKTRKDSTARMMTFDANKVMIVPEVGGIVKLDGKELRVDRIQPVESRKEVYRAVDLREGDQVLLVNGKRVKSIEALREAYDGVATGSEVKLGLQRGEELLSVAFPKADPKDLPGVRIIRRGGKDGSR